MRQCSKLQPFVIFLLIVTLVSVTCGSFVWSVSASPSSSYYYRFTIDREGFTTAEINFSTDTTGESWVFVPKDLSNWNYSLAPGSQIVQSELVPTSQVPGFSQSLYFYRAFRFQYQSTGLFNMTIKFDFDNGALIMEPRGIFYSPQIGFQPSSNGNAEVLFNDAFQINPDLAMVVGLTANYQAEREKVEPHRVSFTLRENVARLQVEFSIDATPTVTAVKSSDNKTFTFNTVSRYEAYARDVLRFYDRIYNLTTRLFNATLDDVEVQWFLPDFQSLLTVGGYVPVFTGGLGEININIVFVRAVNGTVEVIATHELVHRFLGKAGIPPNDFLWFHEGLAQFVSVNLVSDLGYEGGDTEKSNLENAATQLTQYLGDDDFSEISLQRWTPSYQPPGVDGGWLYAASYYAVSRLPQVVERDWVEYYSRFFELIGQLPSGFNGEKIKNISELALYLSQAANASVASTLKRWGFTVADLYESPVQELIVEAGKTVGAVNPIFQPYKALADYVYQQALSSAEQGDWDTARSLLQMSIALANLAPLFTFLTIIGLLVLVVYLLSRRSRRPRSVVPPPPPEILQPSV